MDSSDAVGWQPHPDVVYRDGDGGEMPAQASLEAVTQSADKMTARFFIYFA